MSDAWSAIQDLLIAGALERTRERELLCAAALAKDRFLQDYIPQCFEAQRAAVICDGVEASDIVLPIRPSLWQRLCLAWSVFRHAGEWRP